MIDLSLQFKLVIFSFIFGFMFSASLEGFNKIIVPYFFLFFLLPLDNIYINIKIINKLRPNII